MTKLGIVGLIIAVPFTGCTALIAYGVYLEREVAYWDRTIDALCAEDGGKNVGLRVYERVMAPENYIKPARGPIPAYIDIPWRLDGIPTHSDEPIVAESVDIQVLRRADPRVAKYSFRITRIADEKVLAEEIRYYRSGGGIQGPDFSEGHSCPKSPQTASGARAIHSRVFINHPLNTGEE